MAWRISPLNSLRVFGATARTGILTTAARKLNVTQSAVRPEFGTLESFVRIEVVPQERHPDQVIPAVETITAAADEITQGRCGLALTPRSWRKG